MLEQTAGQGMLRKAGALSPSSCHSSRVESVAEGPWEAWQGGAEVNTLSSLAGLFLGLHSSQRTGYPLCPPLHPQEQPGWP